jgi:hypothetical protein
MARVPVVESPCPIAGKQLPAGSTEHCSLCDRSVHNLDLIPEAERVAFMRSCTGKVCVAYTVEASALRRSALRRSATGRAFAPAVAAGAAAFVMLPAAAQTPSDIGPQPSPVGEMSPLPGLAERPLCDELDMVIVVGGVLHGDQAEWTDDGKDAPPELPTIEDDGR